MTIYDADYADQLAAEEAATKTQAVNDSVAESPVAIAEEQEIIQEPVAEVQEEVSNKEMNFRALRDSMAQMKAEREAERAQYQRQLDELRMQMHQVPKQESKHALDDQSDDDLLTVGKYRQTVREMQQRHEEQLAQLRLEQEEVRARIQNPDYDEVMEKYSIPLLKENRDFARAFQASENKAAFAYQLGKMQMLSQQASQPVEKSVEQPQPSRNAQRMVDNARKPGTLSSARGGQPSLSKADYWATCSDAEFQAEMAKNLAEV